MFSVVYCFGIVSVNYSFLFSKNKIITIFENSFPAAPISLLSSYQETCGVCEVNKSCFSMVVQCSRIHQVLDWEHVFIAGLYVYIQAADYSRSALPIEKEEIILGLCRGKDRKNRLIICCFAFQKPLKLWRACKILTTTKGHMKGDLVKILCN